MSSRKNRAIRRFELESLEGRIALSHMGAAVEDGPHHHRRGHAAEVHTLRRRADDPANHDVNDNRGGADDPADHDANDERGGGNEAVHGGGGNEAVHHHRRGGAVAGRRGGAEHPAGHK